MSMMHRALWLGAILLVAALGGVVLVRRADPGTDVRNVTVGLYPRAVAVDARTGLAFVVDGSFGRFIAPAGSVQTNSGSFANGGGAFPSGGGAFPGEDGKVSVLDVSAARVLRTVSVGPDPRDVAVDERGGAVFVTNDDDATVAVLDARSGALERSIQVGSRPHALTVDPREHRAFVVNSEDGTISVLDTIRQQVVHTFSAGERAAPDPTVVDAPAGRIILSGSDGLQVLDARLGTVVRSIASGQTPDAVAVDPSSQLAYVAVDAGVSVLDLRSGRVLRSFAVAGGAPTAIALDPRRGRLIVTHFGQVDASGTPLGAGTANVLDVRNGAVVGTFTVGVAPGAIAVDEATGRVVVVNQGGVVRASDPLGWVPSWLRRGLPFLKSGSSGTRSIPGSVSIFDLPR
ncbi:MAG: YncE family protein [Chloroflexi bacterium]|nr:YncE family protein [Chloroflexota bacterium]